ncbi:MAG: hypothetical protein KDK48_05455, partial [Chlamydiia bacterium]|nr:hypothetical protein [Chlamydiia bacterium]
MPRNFPIRESNSTNFDQFQQAIDSLPAEQLGDERIVDFALAWLRSHDLDLRFVDYRAVESLLGRIGTKHPSRAVELQSVLQNFFSPEELAATARSYLDEDADAEDEEILRNCLQLMGKQDTHTFKNLFANSPLSGNSLRMALEQIALLTHKQRQIVGAFMAKLSEGEWDEHLCVYLGMFPEKEIEPLLELAYPLVKRLPLGAMRVQALETLKAIHPPDRQGQMGEALSKTSLEELCKELGSFRMFPKNTFSTLCRYGPPPSEMLERIEVTPEL